MTLDLAAELRWHLRGQGFASADELLTFAAGSSSAEYRRAACARIAHDLGRAAEVQLRLEAAYAGARRPRLRALAQRAFATLMAMQSLAHAFEAGDQAAAREALRRIGAA